MINFFIKILTLIFIGLGLVNPSIEIPTQELILHTEIVTEEKTLEQLKIENLENEIRELRQEKEDKKTEVIKSIEKTYIAPVVVIPEEIIPPKETVVEVSVVESTNGECGVSSSFILEENFDKDILCSVGELTDLEKQDGKLEYICEGLNVDSINAKCFVYYIINGECADIEDESDFNLSQETACQKGVFSNLESEKLEFGSEYYQYSYKYNCEGVNQGSYASCSVNSKIYTKEVSSPCTGWACGSVSA